MDTTLDLSQKAEKRLESDMGSESPLFISSALLHAGLRLTPGTHEKGGDQLR